MSKKQKICPLDLILLKTKFVNAIKMTDNIAGLTPLKNKITNDADP